MLQRSCAIASDDPVVEVWIWCICNVEGARIDGGAPAEHEVMKATDALATLHEEVRDPPVLLKYRQQVARAQRGHAP